ncbi:MAG TPA: hypothetical protein VFY23_02070 [Candidatus Limnocylindrales bacterium]|nr:hypothetical protein [Candidatus Limnocylindrales bacterium]
MERIVVHVLVLVLAGVLAVTGCTPRSLPPSAAPAASLESTAVPAASVDADPSLVGPPAARLGGDATGAQGADGSLASWTWDDAGDEAPWFVPADAVTRPPGAALPVTLDPAAVPAAWTARWAPVAGGQPGDVAATAAGAARPVELIAPVVPGAWTLLVEASFGEGRSVAWTWAVDVRE